MHKDRRSASPELTLADGSLPRRGVVTGQEGSATLTPTSEAKGGETLLPASAAVAEERAWTAVPSLGAGSSSPRGLGAVSARRGPDWVKSDAEIRMVFCFFEVGLRGCK